VASSSCPPVWIVQPLRVTSNDGAAGVGLFDEIVAVIGEDAGACGRGFGDASAERIVLEGDRAAAAGQRNGAHAVLEVPGISCRAAPIRLAYCVPIVVVRVRHAWLGRELVRQRFCKSLIPGLFLCSNQGCCAAPF